MSDYRNLKRYLQPGDLARTAKKFNMTRGAISQIISGKTRNNKVLEHIYQLAKKGKELDEQIMAL